MAIYVLKNFITNEVKTFKYIRNAYSFVVDYLKVNNLYTDENFKELIDSYDRNNFTGFYIKGIFNCFRTVVEDYKED